MTEQTEQPRTRCCGPDGNGPYNFETDAITRPSYNAGQCILYERTVTRDLFIKVAPLDKCGRCSYMGPTAIYWDPDRERCLNGPNAVEEKYKSNWLNRRIGLCPKCGFFHCCYPWKFSTGSFGLPIPGIYGGSSITEENCWNKEVWIDKDEEEWKSSFPWQKDIERMNKEYRDYKEKQEQEQVGGNNG